MIDVVKHALEAIPGPPEQIVVLLQPTQPLRQPKHVMEAIRLLRETPEADSVVSVVEIPQTHHPAFTCTVHAGRLHPQQGLWWVVPRTRQAVDPVYIRDGTVYAFRRGSVVEYDDLYGMVTLALIIPPEENCPLDTPEEWAEAERRLTR